MRKFEIFIILGCFKNNFFENCIDFFVVKLDLLVFGVIVVIREGKDINIIIIVSWCLLMIFILLFFIVFVLLM